LQPDKGTSRVPFPSRTAGALRGREMSKWIYGIELVHPPYSLKEFELLELVKGGLQPYFEDGSPIPCPLSCHEAHALQELPFHRMDDARKREVSERLEEIRRDPQRRSWKYFFLAPTDPLFRKKILHDKIWPLLWQSLFLMEDLERLGLVPEVESPGPSDPKKMAQGRVPKETLEELVKEAGSEVDGSVNITTINPMVASADNAFYLNQPIQSGNAEVATLSFFENRDRWFIGPPGSELQFKRGHRGFEYLHELLSNPRESLCAEDLYGLRRDPQYYYKKASEYSGMTKAQLATEGLYVGCASIREVTKKEKDGVDEPTFSTKAVENAVEVVQEELDELNTILPDLLTQDQEQKIRELEELIKLSRSQVRECDQTIKTSDTQIGKEKAKSRETMRVSVTDSINDAIRKIHKDLPLMNAFLNKSTISTGYTVLYRPHPDSPVKWILHPADLPATD
jgi:hypothetical protein